MRNRGYGAQKWNNIQYYVNNLKFALYISCKIKIMPIKFTETNKKGFFFVLKASFSGYTWRVL